MATKKPQEKVPPSTDGCCLSLDDISTFLELDEFHHGNFHWPIEGRICLGRRFPSASEPVRKFSKFLRKTERNKKLTKVVDFLKDTFPESGTCCRLMEDALTLLWLDENC